MQDRYKIAKDSVRHKDNNGFLHIAKSPLTKETVNPYYGSEIPGWKDLGLDPEKIYMGYRKGEELKKAVDTFNGIPVLLDHQVDMADNPLKELRVGSTGTSAKWEDPYIINAISITDQAGIDVIENGSQREISACYVYEPVFESGSFQGQAYDFIMTNIKANHVALVEEGRAGSDVYVYDSKIKGDDTMKSPEKLKEAAALFMDALNEFLDEESGEEAHDKDNEYREVMTEAGCDADNEQERKAFAEGVKFGEKLEKNPEERKKLDSEHESEGMKKAMDEVGCDSDNEQERKAFAEGVKFGEKLEKNPEERKKLDREHESEGMKKALGEDNETAKDRKIAIDKAVARAKADMMQDIKKLVIASNEVKASIKVDPFAYDSAEEIYKKALLFEGIDIDGVHKSAYRSLYNNLKKRSIAGDTSIAMDYNKTKDIDNAFTSNVINNQY